MPYEVKLTYFGKNGKCVGKGHYETKMKKLYEIIDEVKEKHCTSSLPGVYYDCFNLSVMIDVPNHPANLQHLLPPTTPKVQTT